MASRKRIINTVPFKSIVIAVHPDFVPRLKTGRVGKFARGVTSGLSISGYIAFILEVNEYLPKEHKLTDFQIAKCCATEFPKRERMQRLLEVESGVGHKRKGRHCSFSISSYRQRYNKGTLLAKSNGCRLGPISFKYNSEGDKISFHGKRPLSQREFDGIMSRYGPETRGDIPFDWKLQQKRQYKPKGRPDPYESFDWCI